MLAVAACWAPTGPTPDVDPQFSVACDIHDTNPECVTKGAAVGAVAVGTLGSCSKVLVQKQNAWGCAAGAIGTGGAYHGWLTQEGDGHVDVPAGWEYEFEHMGDLPSQEAFVEWANGGGGSGRQWARPYRVGRP
jgi:hypothetical protein